MAMDRRDFVIGGSVLGATLLAAVGSRTAAQKSQPNGPAELKLSSQDGVIPGAALAQKVAKMAAWGMQGLEVGGGGLPGRVAEIKRALEGTPIKVSAICAGYASCLLADAVEERRKCVASMKEILTAAGELGSTGLIVVPAFNGQSNLSNREARPILVDLLREVGDHAQRCGTRLLLEPLNRGEAFFLRQLADAASICRDVNNPGVGMMGDFYHMYIEETSDLGAFLSAGQYLHHVHLASRRRVLPGQDDRSFVAGFRGLQMIGYRDFCSFECGVEGDREVEIPKALAFLRNQWREAEAMT